MPMTNFIQYTELLSQACPGGSDGAGCTGNTVDGTQPLVTATEQLRRRSDHWRTPTPDREIFLEIRAAKTTAVYKIGSTAFP